MAITLYNEYMAYKIYNQDIQPDNGILFVSTGELAIKKNELHTKPNLDGCHWLDARLRPTTTARLQRSAVLCG